MKTKEKKHLDIPLDFLFENFLDEGVHDKSIFKAVFLAGGSGSGKDYVLSKTLDGHGLTEINSDKALEFLMDKHKLDKKMPDSEERERTFLRGKAKNMTELKQRLAIHGKNGLIVNGTGADHEHVSKVKDMLEKHGYETSMVMVHTSDEASRKRNIARGDRGGRTVPEDVRAEKWKGAQANRPKYKELFGDHYHEFDNSHDKDTAPKEVINKKEKELMDIHKKIKKFVSKPTDSLHANNWIASELAKKQNNTINKKEQVLMPHPTSTVHKTATNKGLEYYGSGKYGQKGKVTHHSVNNKLLSTVNENFDQFLNEEVNISISADTPEEAIHTMNLLRGEPSRVPDTNTMSDKVPKNLLTLGRGFGVIEPQVSAGSVNIMPSLSTEEDQEEKKPHNYLADKNGNPRVFMLRHVAAKEAHVKNGDVVKTPKGYHVKLKEDVQMMSESVINEIDAGTEQGMSLSGHNKEFLGKDGKITSVRKKGLKELTGDTTTHSIGAQKDDELKKQGISLATFRSKNPL